MDRVRDGEITMSVPGSEAVGAGWTMFWMGLWSIIRSRGRSGVTVSMYSVREPKRNSDVSGTTPSG